MLSTVSFDILIERLCNKISHVINENENNERVNKLKNYINEYLFIYNGNDPEYVDQPTMLYELTDILLYLLDSI